MSDATQAPVPDPTVPPPNDSPRDKRSFWLGVGIVVLVSIIVLLLFFKTIPADNKDVLNTVIGVVVGTGFGSVIGWFFGSSQSSKDKDDTINSLSKT